MKFKKKKAAAFGSYGWSGESVKIISRKLEECGFEVPLSGVRQLWSPDDEGQETCRELGRHVARQF
ncbi:hypothetical protein DSLASN_13280 [Desulfoluna limicola]|uniref:Anaerobic nitric oxide reductase flavorubredoxin n=1 Tax=Desulfoluna limicola TaxID=2810562 RepID=A0ABM7PF51_9BACT|nr:hypothetical protein DSLASN_13280 [Desulfoluna limicola]